MSAESLTQLLNLPNIRVTNLAFEKEEEQEYLHLFGEHEYKIAMCPCCGETSTSFHDGKERRVRHLDIWGKPSIRFTLKDGALIVTSVKNLSRRP